MDANTAPEDNVLLFPVERIKSPLTTAFHSSYIPRTLVDIKDVVKKNKIDRIASMMDLIVPVLVKTLAEYGCVLNQESIDELKYVEFAIEALYALMYRISGLDHKMDELIQTVIEITDGEVIFRPINVKLKKVEEE